MELDFGGMQTERAVEILRWRADFYLGGYGEDGGTGAGAV
jgi:hypothetical protein